VLIPLTPFVTRDPYEITATPFVSPCPEHPFGTDNLGRDMFSRTLYGIRVSMLVGFLGGIISMGLGMFVGGISGYFGGGVDMLLQRMTEIFQIIPSFFLAVTLVALFGANLWLIIAVVSLLLWPSSARLARAEFMRIKQLDYVQAARAIGASSPKIIFGEILVNAINPVLVNTLIRMCGAILLETGLSFLGLGDPRAMSWGVLLGIGRNYLREAWWMVTFPALLLFITVAAINMVGTGLDEALNPKKLTKQTVDAYG
jgi:peptide/nickel transport system permease protein